MGRIVITEDEKNDILNKHKDADKTSQFGDMKRRILDHDLTPMSLAKFKDLGLKPYQFSDDISKDDFGFSEITGKVKRPLFNHKPIEVYLLTEEEYEQISKFTKLIKETITHSLKKISLLKEMIPATMVAIMKKN